MKKLKGNGRPLQPRIGQLWFEPASRSMRRWDGAKWAEVTQQEVSNDIQNRKKSIAGRAISYTGKKTPR